jgi:hypothetical protein
VASLGYAWTCSLGSCLGRSLPSKGGSALRSVVKCATQKSNTPKHTTRLSDAFAASGGPAWSTATRHAMDRRRLRSWAASGLNGRMLALPLNMHALVPIETA